MAVDRCATCQGIISASDEAFHWGELLVCRTCYAGLASNQPEPALARPVQFGALTIGPDVLTVGSVMLPIRNIASVQSLNVRESTEESGMVALYLCLGIGLPLVIGVVAVGIGNMMKHAPQWAATTAMLACGVLAIAAFCYFMWRAIGEWGGKRSAIFLLVTATSGQQVRIDFANQLVMQHALSVLRQAVAAAHGSTTFNTLNAVIVNRSEIQRRTS